MLGWPKLISFSIALHIASASAALVNHTIDDAFGDDAKTGSVTYDSPDSWHQGQGLKCTGCSVAAGAGDPSHWGDSQGPYMGTWHTNQDTESVSCRHQINSATFERSIYCPSPDQPVDRREILRQVLSCVEF